MEWEKQEEGSESETTQNKVTTFKLGKGLVQEIDKHLQKHKKFGSRSEYIRFIIMRDLEDE